MGIFNQYLKEGKGIRKEDVSKKVGLKRFFSIFGDKFWKLLILNVLFFLINVPVFGLFAYLAGVGGEPYHTPVNVLFQPLSGVMLHGENPALQALYGVVGIQTQHSYPTLATNILLWFGLLSFITFGIGTAAITYIQRNYIKGTPVDLTTDFVDSIKRNWKQSILLGILDLVLLFVLLFDLFNYVYAGQSFLTLVMMYATAFLSILYLLMRPYLYLMCVTFDIKIRKMLKNALIMATNGWKRNVPCGLLALFVLFLNVIVFSFIPSLGVGMFFVFTISVAWFFQIYGAWPVLKKNMIDPFYEETEEDAQEEVVFRDRG